MEFKEYQEQAGKTIKDESKNYAYLVLGLCSEAGEVADKFKKHVRDGKPLYAENVAKELGDVLWYVAMLSEQLGYSLDEVANMNLDKLFSRKDRGKIEGSGDNR